MKKEGNKGGKEREFNAVHENSEGTNQKWKGLFMGFSWLGDEIPLNRPQP